MVFSRESKTTDLSTEALPLPSTERRLRGIVLYIYNVITNRKRDTNVKIPNSLIVLRLCMADLEEPILADMNTIPTFCDSQHREPDLLVSKRDKCNFRYYEQATMTTKKFYLRYPVLHNFRDVGAYHKFRIAKRRQWWLQAIKICIPVASPMPSHRSLVTLFP